MTEDPARDFVRVCEVLRGDVTDLPRTREVAKMLAILLAHAGSDSEITRRGFEVRYPGRRSCPYFSRLAPGVLHALTAQRSTCPGGQALRFRLDADEVRALVGFDGRAPAWVWIVPGDEVVLVCTRPPTDPGPPPLEPPPLPPPPARSKKLFAHLRVPLACPHCARLAEVYRAAVDAWVCLGPRCGRSFSPPQRARADADLREDDGASARELAPRAKIYR